MRHITFSISRSFWNERIEWRVGGKNLFNVQDINAIIAGGGAHTSGSGSLPVSWGKSFFTRLVFKTE